MAKNRGSREVGKAQFSILKRRNTKTKIQNASHDALQSIDTIDDPRTRHCDYPLREILFLAVVAYLCDAKSNGSDNSFPSKTAFPLTTPFGESSVSSSRKRFVIV
jgi:hypothetical protein